VAMVEPPGQAVVGDDPADSLGQNRTSMVPHSPTVICGGFKFNQFAIDCQAGLKVA